MNQAEVRWYCVERRKHRAKRFQSLLYMEVLPVNHRPTILAAALCCLFQVCLAQPDFSLAQVPLAQQVSQQEAIVDQAGHVLKEIMAAPEKRIPRWMLADAEAIAVVPDVVKGGFVVGGRFGRGVVIVRDEQGAWHAPSFVTLTGGSFGFQAGLQATDVILVFKTRNSVKGLMDGKFTVGADASVAAGPVGRQAAAATDGNLRAEIYSYSRSRGLFAGVALDGSVLQVDALSNAAYYRAGLIGQRAELPASATEFMKLVAQYTTQADGAEKAAADGMVEVAPVESAGAEGGAGPQIPAANTAGEVTNRQLVTSWNNLAGLLDATWQSYLALPAEVYSNNEPPPRGSIEAVLARFDRVAADARYRALAGRPEFEVTHARLREYAKQLPANSGKLQLPPPPGDAQ